MILAIETDKLAQTTSRETVAGSNEEMYRLTSRGEGLMASGGMSLAFGVFTGVLVVAAVIVAVLAPETRAASLERVQARA